VYDAYDMFYHFPSIQEPYSLLKNGNLQQKHQRNNLHRIRSKSETSTISSIDMSNKDHTTWFKQSFTSSE
jgi:hypothetical protein